MANPSAAPILTPAIVAALKALSDGKANEGQQKTALEWILIEASGIREVSYQDGEKPLATAFREGRRFVGLVIAGAIQARPVTPVRTPRQKQSERQKSDDQPK